MENTTNRSCDVIICSLLGCCAGSLLLIGCGPRAQQVASDVPPDAFVVAGEMLPPTAGDVGVPSQHVQAFTASGHDGATHTQWRVTGETARVIEDQAPLNDVDSIRRTAEGEAHVEAERGVFDPQTRDVRLEGDVMAHTTDGMTLESASMDWSEADQTLSTEEEVTMRQRRMEVASHGGAAKSGLKTAAFAEQVTMTIYPATVITCDGALEVDYDNSKAVFHENVHVTDERGELFADVMEVQFTPEHEIQQVIATGNVRIVRGEDTAYAEQATYLQREGRVLLTGAPKLIIFPSGKQVD